MKQMKKVTLAVLTTIAMLCGCTATNEEQEIKKISVVQIVSHPSLDTIRDSFTDEMEALGYVDGENIEIEYYDAGNNTSTLESILSTVSGDGTDVITAIATPTAQGAANYADEIPVIFAAVSDPINSGLTTTLEKPDKNIFIPDRATQS